MLHNRGPKYNKVQLCGSFDEWKVRHDMQFDTFTNQWYITQHLNVGEEYFYKYIVNEQHWVVNDEEKKSKDPAGNMNNICGFYD
jgi:1,4-alpha-glucan branching enzyme